MDLTRAASSVPADDLGCERTRRPRFCFPRGYRTTPSNTVPGDLAYWLLAPPPQQRNLTDTWLQKTRFFFNASVKALS
jgi:hypothetical protein